MLDNIIRNVNKKTTISISKLTKISLNSLKKTKRETYNLLLRRLLEPDIHFKIDYTWTYQGDSEESTPPVKVIGIKTEQKKTLIKPDEIVILDNEIYIFFDYPLDNEVLIKYKLKTGNGFTRLYLWECIYEGYKRIYKEEEETSIKVKKAKDMTEEELKKHLKQTLLYNRIKTKGMYGIWGHYIDDLWIEGVHYNSKTKIVELDIGS